MGKHHRLSGKDCQEAMAEVIRLKLLAMLCSMDDLTMLWFLEFIQKIQWAR